MNIKIIAIIFTGILLALAFFVERANQSRSIMGGNSLPNEGHLLHDPPVSKYPGLYNGTDAVQVPRVTTSTAVFYDPSMDPHRR